ncbi:hypothetical protein PL8927_480009 [Planktothrix serta PCC 8927]|uniref:Uncharacterized protein n=1 Tax=Planktothrix serta PCC 8927 TaxID=671068 RepID=A0A7Z9BP58_9CYAN|nr:hypothetical protein PL8927_480009 [Planktothrix serta PCC 8927]
MVQSSYSEIFYTQSLKKSDLNYTPSKINANLRRLLPSVTHNITVNRTLCHYKNLV